MFTSEADKAIVDALEIRKAEFVKKAIELGMTKDLALFLAEEINK